MLTTVVLEAAKFFTKETTNPENLLESLKKVDSSQLNFPRTTNITSYIPVFECDYFSIFIFQLSHTNISFMPIHDHPNMTVFTRVIKGNELF